MKCKTHGEVSGCATQKQADSEKEQMLVRQRNHKCGGDVIDPEAMPGSKLRYFCEDHVGVDAFGRRQNHEPQPTPRSDGRSCRSLSTQGMRHSARDDLEVGEIYKYYCDDHPRSTLTRYRRYLFL
jgi:hypothetical protein